MTSDHDVLLRAICANPDDDTPRLIFADYLDENNQPDRAAFIRAQVELARTPAWEPFAVTCRHRRREWDTGDPFRGTLPYMEGWHAEWMPLPFRRGFGWSAFVRSLIGWDEFAPRLFALAPVGELDLPTAVLDDWRQFAAGDWVRHLRRITFRTWPVEPIRVLSDTPAATGITDIAFGRASSPAMPEIVEDLLRTPLGKGLRGLSFHAGYSAVDLLMDAIADSGVGLDRLSFSNMGVTGEHVHRLCRGPGAARLKELELHNEPLGVGLDILATHLFAPDLHTLVLSQVGAQANGLELLGRAEAFAGLRRLDLSRNPLRPRATRVLAASPSLAGLRSLNLSRCTIGDKGVRHLAAARFWMNLVELDLRENPISGAGARALLGSPVPPDLTALLLDARGLDGDARSKLRHHFGERVVLTPG